MIHTLKRIASLISIILALGVILLILPYVITRSYARPRTYKISDVPTRRVAIVFGAGLWRDGSPTPVLRDRIATAAELYFAGKVEKLLMSGDNRIERYNEPAAMHEYALSLGVPNEDIIMDFAGRRTYDTCYRAREIFDVRDAILVTQSFHLPRAIYTCNFLKLPAEGVPADLRKYHRRSWFYWNLREIPATVVAFIEVFITQPLPVLGNTEKVFPQEAQ